MLITVAIAGKVFGAGLAARFIGFGIADASAIGIAMNARGAVEPVIADIALRAGIFKVPSPPPAIIDNLFSAVVIMAITTTLITPLGHKFIFNTYATGKK